MCIRDRLVANAGTGYKIGDVVTIQSGNNDAQVAITCLKTELNSQGTSGEGGAGGIRDMRVEVEKDRIYVPDPNGLEMGVTDVVIVDSGSAFLPNTVRSELDIDPTSPTFGQVTTKEVKPNPDESYDGETSYLTSLGKVKVKNSGFGYSPNDTATVVSDGGTGLNTLNITNAFSAAKAAVPNMTNHDNSYNRGTAVDDTGTSAFILRIFQASGGGLSDADTDHSVTIHGDLA